MLNDRINQASNARHSIQVSTVDAFQVRECLFINSYIADYLFTQASFRENIGIGKGYHNFVVRQNS